MKERIAIIDGLRTPFCKAYGIFNEVSADDLGAFAVKELLARTSFPAHEIDEVIFGNVALPIEAANIARVIALKAGLSSSLIAHTVQRNCASGMQSITAGANALWADEAQVILAGGAESMSQIPLIYSSKMARFFFQLAKSKNIREKLKTFTTFRPSFLKPIIGLEKGLTDPMCNMIMGLTAEKLSREFHITREEQDAFALTSHHKGAAAHNDNLFKDEMIPVFTPPSYKIVQEKDDGIRSDQTRETLAKLKPYFNKYTGSVTIGNSCQVTDGAAAVIIMKESTAKERGLKPLGYLRSYAYAALDGSRMGLGPVYSTAKLLDKTGLTLKDFDLIELNEAFAAQVLACEKAFGSIEFAKKFLGRTQAVGELPMDALNVNGGAIALGHPVGATGTRLVITLLRELRRRNKNRGLATLCVGGGQGASLALEVE